MSLSKILSSIAIFFSVYVFSQLDSTDISFYRSNVQYESLQDSLKFPNDIYSEYFLGISISDLSHVSEILVELSFSNGKTPQILLHKVYSKNGLVQSGFFSQGLLSINLGIYEIRNYLVNILLINNNGRMNKKITKSIVE